MLKNLYFCIRLSFHPLSPSDRTMDYLSCLYGKTDVDCNILAKFSFHEWLVLEVEDGLEFQRENGTRVYIVMCSPSRLTENT